MSGIIEEELKIKLEAILNSKMMLVQKIHAIKTFLVSIVHDDDKAIGIEISGFDEKSSSRFIATK